MTSFKTGLSRAVFPKVVEREGPTPAPEPCLWCLLVAFSSPLALAMPPVLFRIGSCLGDELKMRMEIQGRAGRTRWVKEGAIVREGKIEKLVCVEENNEESLQES